MKNLKTLTAKVIDGKVTLNLPEYINGTKLELEIISIANPINDQQVDQTIGESERDYNHGVLSDTETLINTPLLFEDLYLIDPLLQAVAEKGYKYPSPIQIQAIPLALEGNDILGTAQTGSGKTAAFALPILQHLTDKKYKGKPYPRSLILSPTRELAIQIGESIASYGEHTGIKHVTIYGGVSQRPQVNQLKRGVDILVATPGRLLDLIDQGEIDLDRIEIMVLDEADRMLDMGFINDIRKVMRMIPEACQIMLFSATMPPQILDLADKILANPKRVSVDPPTSTVDTVESFVFFVEKPDKFDLLLHILTTENITKALVFMRTKHSANKVVRKLIKENIQADAIHGNKSQSAREKALFDFKNDRIAVLVATDIAARGIDIDDITHVINFDMSNEPETYIHRIGRTARAGKSGSAYNFCMDSERPFLVDVERLVQQHLIRTEGYPYMSSIRVPGVTDLHATRRGNVSGSKKKRAGKTKHKRKRYHNRGY
jgi:ATP-dependent RNA helicase RhlE